MNITRFYRAGKQFARDRDGAIAMTAVIALPGTAALTWYELVTAKQALLRNATQGAADAIALGGAGALAGGMNILAMINVIMAVVLSIFIAIRVVEILSIAAAALFFALSFIPGFEWADAMATRAGDMAENAFELEGKVAPKIMHGLNIATQGERMIARAFPYISSAVSVVMARAKVHEPGFGIAGNMDLVPTAIDRVLEKGSQAATKDVIGFPARMGAIQDGKEDPAAAPVAKTLAQLATIGATNMVGSLPVEGEGYTQICSRAAAEWASLPFVQKIPFLDKLGLVLSVIGGNIPGLLCQPLSETKDTLEKQATQATKDAVNAKAEAVVKAGCEADSAAGKLSKGPKRGQRSDADNLKNCIKGRAANWKGSQAGKDFKTGFEKDQQAKLDKLKEDSQTDEIETAKLWSLITDGGATVPEPDPNAPPDPDAQTMTTHGVTLPEGAPITVLDPNLFMNSYSIYRAPDGRLKTGLDFQAIATLTGASVDEAKAPFLGYQKDWSSAKARMYFNCGKTDVFKRKGADHGIHSCADNSLWRPGGWTFTLGVDRPLSAEAEATGKQIVSGYVGWITGEVAQKLMGAVLGNSKFGLGAYANKPGSSSLGIWADRFKGTVGDKTVKDNLGNMHVLDWWLGNTAGNAVDAKLNHKEFELQPYLR